MTDAPKPVPMPIADAFAAAEQARLAADKAAEAAREAETERERDRASVIRIFNREGMAKAKRMGKLYGLSADEVQAICEPPETPPDMPGQPRDDRPPTPPTDPDAPPPVVKRKNPVKTLPGTCPVTPLGTSGGQFYYLSPLKELRAMTKHGADDLRALFAQRAAKGENTNGIDWLWETFAKFDKQGRHSGWDPAHAGESLMTACAARGVFDPSAMLRGLGAWTDASGSLVLHCGDAVYASGAWHAPGLIGEHVYPGFPASPRPVDGEADTAPGKALLDLIDKWPWRWGEDPDVPEMIHIGPHISISPASLLMLGWTGCAQVGGALDWRPMVWVTGDAGGGKSTLQKVIQGVFGGGMVASSDATSAGIYQSVGYSSRAVAIDEAEADPFSPKMKNMIELVRQSASGGVILRGSNDAKVKGFTTRSAFLLSSIIIPPLNAQDLTRLAILRLGKLTGVTPPKIDPDALRQMGRAFRRRILDRWSEWPARLEAWRGTLAKIGHDARGCDQYGALFAMADLLLADEVADSDTREDWAGTTRFIIDERKASSNADTMLGWLLTKPIDNVFRGGQQYTVRTILRRACGYEELEEGTEASCRSILSERGLVVDMSAGARDLSRVIVLNQHAGLAELFKGTIWGTSPGAAQSGWQQAMSRLPGARATKKFGVRAWSIAADVLLMEPGQ